MNSEYKKAKDHFDSVPKQWNKIYAEENRLSHIFNRVFRKGMFDRFEFTFKKCDSLKDSSILDIGCGTGVYCMEFANKGAARIVGIDIAPSMIEFSKSTAEELSVLEKCEFICGNILNHNFTERFDYIIAMGFFDYSKDSELLFQKISKMKPKKFIASFPKYTMLGGIQRYIRYNIIKNCPIYYYKESDVVQSFKSFGCSNYELLSLNTGFVISVEFN